jgi:hypothetical protein
MRELFKDIQNIEGVNAILMFSFAGDLIFMDSRSPLPEGFETRDWRFLIETLAGIRETDLVFEKGRLYIRRSAIGYLVVFMNLWVPIAMIRLNCDILVSSLKPEKTMPKIRRFFRAAKAE